MLIEQLNDGKPIDQISKKMLNDDNSVRAPILTTGDGNCFFNAVSIATSGNELLALQLRIRCAIEMAVNVEAHKAVLINMHERIIASVGTEYYLASIECAQRNKYTSATAFSPMATVLRKTIKSGYPMVNGPLDPNIGLLNNGIVGIV